MNSTQTVLGPQRTNWRDWNPYVVVRHGILSSEAAFRGLSAYIKGTFPNAVVDNQTYQWKDNVVLNGARLAKALLANRDAEKRPLVLVGHSMGGLVCRVANLLLTEPTLVSQNRGIFLNYYNQKESDLVTLLGLGLEQHKSRSVNLVATLGTPNSGAMLKAQLNALGKVGGGALPIMFESLNDLNTARLFRLFQYFSAATPAMSISGSGWNRMTKTKTDPIFWAPQLAGRLHLPNDMIVEDRSVDLRQSIFPNEILSSAAPKYLHARLYVDCTDVTHTIMYDHGRVREVLIDGMSRC
jgi:pimeloyl-ACP methyl ester carboxylesterase